LFGVVQQRESQAECQVIADASDERDLVPAEVRVALGAHERDAPPDGPAGAEDRAKLGAKAELPVDPSIPGAALRLAVGRLVQGRHGTPFAREVAELREVGLEELVVDEAPADRPEHPRRRVLDGEACEQQRVRVGGLPTAGRVLHHRPQALRDLLEKLERGQAAHGELRDRRLSSDALHAERNTSRRPMVRRQAGLSDPPTEGCEKTARPRDGLAADALRPSTARQQLSPKGLTMTTNPTFLLVHGSWHDGTSWSAVA